MFGPNFKDTNLFAFTNGEDEWFTKATSYFTAKGIKWFYQTFTPWKDCLISYGSRQNILALGWGGSQDIVKTTLNGGTTLPRADSSCDADQLKLARHLAEQSQKRATNILCSHFSYICYEPNLPLLDNKVKKLSVVHSKKYGKVRRIIKIGLIGGIYRKNSGSYDLTKYDYGSFYQNRPEIYELFDTGQGKKNKIHYTISGHTHRCGAYVYESPTTAIAAGNTLSGIPLSGSTGQPGLLRTQNLLGLKSLNLRGENRTVSLLTGSTGLYSRQNLIRGLMESNEQQMEKKNDFEPRQGMKLTFGDDYKVSRVDFVLDPLSKPGLPGGHPYNPKPRLAVRLDYLWWESSMFFPDMSPFIRLGHIYSTGRNMIDHITHIAEGDFLYDRSGSGYKFEINPTWLNFLYPYGLEREKKDISCAIEKE